MKSPENLAWWDGCGRKGWAATSGSAAGRMSVLLQVAGEADRPGIAALMNAAFRGGRVYGYARAVTRASDGLRSI
jgi:hypothetical protein